MLKYWNFFSKKQRLSTKQAYTKNALRVLLHVGLIQFLENAILLILKIILFFLHFLLNTSKYRWPSLFVDFLPGLAFSRSRAVFFNLGSTSSLRRSQRILISVIFWVSRFRQILDIVFKGSVTWKRLKNTGLGKLTKIKILKSYHLFLLIF